MSTATRAIARSQSHDEIVTLEADREVDAELSSLCDDSVDLTATMRRSAHEYWGQDADGPWRVHTLAPEPCPFAEDDDE